MWYVAGLSKEFPQGKPVGHTIVGLPIVLWRSKSGKVVAFDGRCCHKRMPLADGRILDDDTLECAYHGLCYDTEGKCVRIPSQPDGPIPSRAKLKSYPIIEQDGMVWIWTGDAENMARIQPPRIPEMASEEWESIGSDPIYMKANYLLIVENLLDITHFYPLHDGNIGDAENSKIPVEVVQDEVGGIKTVKSIRQVQNYRHPPFYVDYFGYEIVDRCHTHWMVSPAITRVDLRCAPPGKLGTNAERGYILVHTHTPIDESNHVWRWCVNCKANHFSRGDPKKSTAKRIAETFHAVVAQDIWAIEKQQEMFKYPGFTGEVHLRTDTTLLRAREIVRNLVAREAETVAQAAA